MFTELCPIDVSHGMRHSKLDISGECIECNYTYWNNCNVLNKHKIPNHKVKVPSSSLGLSSDFQLCTFF